MIKAIKKVYRYLADSSGFSIPRVLLTVFYALVLTSSAVAFSSSLGVYSVQIPSFFLFAASLLLGYRSLRRMFDRRTKEKITKFLRKITDRIGERMSRLGKKIVHALGLDRMRGYGDDERDFVFRERRRGKKKKTKLYNPLYWQDQESNAERVRYIFIDYMIGRIKEGFRMKPDMTPSDLDRKLASEENEHLLFDVYAKARYSGGREEIGDDTVGLLEELKKK